MSSPAPSEPTGDTGSVTDWISAACSAIAAFIAVITLVTVYIAARQLLTERQAYEMGLSEDILGTWSSKVKSKKLLGMKIHTPTVDLPTLMRNAWSPTIGFSTDQGFKVRRSPSHVEKASAKAGWVNFMDTLGIMSTDEGLYQMSTQSNLVNGIVPMRWSGKDLVGICSMLGFQACEDKPSFKHPMPLPTQWSGPLGWLQFRSSTDGCIVEFRMRGLIDNQLSRDLHSHYKDERYKHEPHCLRSRLWRSINGMYLSKKKALYVGGADREDFGRKMKTKMEELESKAGELSKGLKSTLGELQNLMEKAEEEAEEPHAVQYTEHDDGLFDELMEGDWAPEEIEQKLQLKPPKKTEASPTKDAKNDDDDDDDDTVPEFLQDLKKSTGMKEFLMPCPGVLSIVVEGELAHSRGLNIADSIEYHRKFMALEEADQKTFKYNLGNLYMDDKLLGLFKEALEVLRPDGYFFTGTRMLMADVDDVYRHVEQLTDLSEKLRIFPTFKLDQWPTTNKSRKPLHFAMALCNEFQHIRKHNRATFTVADMVAVAKASQSLRQVHDAPDLTWALLICPTLLTDLAKAFEGVEDLGVFDSPKTTISCRSGKLNCTSLIKTCNVRKPSAEPTQTSPEAPASTENPTSPTNAASLTPSTSTTASATRSTVVATEGEKEPAEYIYEIPLCNDDDFTASRLLAAFMDVMVTFYWVEKRWISDVGLYDTVIPPTIIMC